MSRSDKSGSASNHSSFKVVIAGVIWAFSAAIFFLVYGAGTAKPSDTYLIGTALFEIVAYLAAAILCLRNALSTNNVSGKSVWIGLGGGMALYSLGSCFYAYWEVVLKLNADVSIGDFCYVLSYLFLIYGMLRAVLERRLNLDPKQWAIVLGVGTIGVMIAIYVNNASVTSTAQADFSWMQAAQAQSASPVKPSASPPVKATPAATLKAVPSAVPSKVPASPSPLATPNLEKSEKPVAETKSSAPLWATQLDDALRPFKTPLNWFYVVADSCLLTIATALLTAFWGGRSSQSWRMIAFATFSLYVADIWVKYATKTQGDAYKSGSLPEVFFVFAGVLFAIGAVLEYDLSKSRRSNRRRGA